MTRGTMKILLPNSDRNQAGATLKAGAVIKAVEHFKLQQDVTIKWANGTHRHGAYRWRKGVGHVITLSTYYSAEDTSRTLWHELTHALQIERAASKGKAYADWSAEQRRYAYSVRPIEVQARKFAEHYHPQLPLAA